jgi:hypothetical protein
MRHSGRVDEAVPYRGSWRRWSPGGQRRGRLAHWRVGGSSPTDYMRSMSNVNRTKNLRYSHFLAFSLVRKISVEEGEERLHFSIEDLK